MSNGKDRSTADLPPTLHNKKLKPSEKSELSNLQEYITLKSDVNGIDPALIGNKNELTKFIRNIPAPSRQKQGWRKVFLAEMGN